MSRFWRVISWSGGLVLIAAGTLLLMGSLRTSANQTVQLEQARLEAMARRWESRLENTRLFLHDQMVTNSILDALEHPEDWSDARLENKLDAVRSTWAQDNGTLRGMVLLKADGNIYTTYGDTAGFREAAAAFRSDPSTDIALLTGNNALTRLLAMYYRPAPADPVQHPGRVIALINGEKLFAPESDSPMSWSLMSSPAEILMASSSAGQTSSVSNAIWPLLLSQKAGTIKQENGSTLCFACLHLPGVAPMLLAESIRPGSAASGLPFGLLVLGVVVLSLLALSMRTARPVVESPAETIPDENTAADPTGFRHIFQTIEDPVCVLDTSCRVVRANRSAQDWLRLNKGVPSGAVVMQLSYGEFTLTEFLARAVEDPAATSGYCRMITSEAATEGTLTTTRLSRDDEGRGPVLIHFHPQASASRGSDDRLYMPPEVTGEAAEPSRLTHESHCPFPVLSVTPGGLITSFNAAAQKSCPRLEETPLLSDVLPGLESRDLSTLLSSSPGTVFESLFGSNPHEFEIVHAEGQTLLYAHKLSASKKLEVELKQAQESFYTLCALSPVPVLLVDPRDHAILEANNASADLFGFTPVDLRGKLLDSLTSEPWDFSAGEDLYMAASTSGRATRCFFRYELIKIEGMPTLLVVLEPVPDILTPQEDSMPSSEEMTPVERPAVPAAPPPLPIGPALLITLNPTVREVARRLFEKVNHPCEVFTCLDDATVWLITHDMRPEFVALDLTDFDDAEVWIEELRTRCGDVPCVAFTDGADYELPSGPNALLAKPFDLQSLSDALTSLHLETSVCESA